MPHNTRTNTHSFLCFPLGTMKLNCFIVVVVGRRIMQTLIVNIKSQKHNNEVLYNLTNY